MSNYSDGEEVRVGDLVEIKIAGKVLAVDIGLPSEPVALVEFVLGIPQAVSQSVIDTNYGKIRAYILVSQLTHRNANKEV